MPVIEKTVVQLIADTKKFREDMKAAYEDFKKFQEETSKQKDQSHKQEKKRNTQANKDRSKELKEQEKLEDKQKKAEEEKALITESANKRGIHALESFRRTFVATVALMAGGFGFKQLIKNATDSTIAIDNLSRKANISRDAIKQLNGFSEIYTNNKNAGSEFYDELAMGIANPSLGPKIAGRFAGFTLHGNQINPYITGRDGNINVNENIIPELIQSLQERKRNGYPVDQSTLHNIFQGNNDLINSVTHDDALEKWNQVSHTGSNDKTTQSLINVKASLVENELLFQRTISNTTAVFSDLINTVLGWTAKIQRIGNGNLAGYGGAVVAGGASAGILTLLATILRGKYSIGKTALEGIEGKSLHPFKASVKGGIAGAILSILFEIFQDDIKNGAKLALGKGAQGAMNYAPYTGIAHGAFNSSRQKYVSDDNFNSFLNAVNYAEDSNGRIVSSTGAIGPYQIQPTTAYRYGINGDLRDPQVSRDGASIILNDLLSRFHGNLKRAYFGYQAGGDAFKSNWEELADRAEKHKQFRIGWHNLQTYASWNRERQEKALGLSSQLYRQHLNNGNVTNNHTTINKQVSEKSADWQLAMMAPSFMPGLGGTVA